MNKARADLRLILVGAGGHAKVVLEAVRAAALGEVVGLIDPVDTGEVLGARVLGGDELLPRLRAEGIEAAIIALGGNALRDAMAAKLQGLDFQLPVVIHPTAHLSASAQIGNGAVIMARAVVGTATEVGELAIVNTGAVLDHDNRLGRAAHIAPGCALAGNVTVGDRALIGVGSAVRPGIQIGADAVVGAGSAVITDVPAGMMVGGVPARPISRKKDA